LWGLHYKIIEEIKPCENASVAFLASLITFQQDVPKLLYLIDKKIYKNRKEVSKTDQKNI